MNAAMPVTAPGRAGGVTPARSAGFGPGAGVGAAAPSTSTELSR